MSYRSIILIVVITFLISGLISLAYAQSIDRQQDKIIDDYIINLKYNEIEPPEQKPIDNYIGLIEKGYNLISGFFALWFTKDDQQILDTSSPGSKIEEDYTEQESLDSSQNAREQLLIQKSPIIINQSSINKTYIQKIAAETFKFCNNKNRSRSNNKGTCYSKEFEKIAYNLGSNLTYEILFELQKLDSRALGCHFIGHGIGYGTYKRNPKNWQNFMNSINPSCTYGSVHGVMEQHVDSLPNSEYTKELMPTLCGSDPRADCNHIIGHLTLVETTGDIDIALDMCSVFEDNRQNFYCLTGVFMEHITALNLIEHGLAPKSWLKWTARVDDLEILCRSHKGTNATACWKEISHAALIKFKHDPNKIFDFCNTAQDVEGAKRCKRHSLGIMSARKKYDIKSLSYVCAIKQPSNDPYFETDCYNSLVSRLLYSSSQDKAEGSVSFCSSLNLKFRESCFRRIGRTLKVQSASKNYIEELCSNAPKEFKTQCINGMNSIKLES